MASDEILVDTTPLSPAERRNSLEKHLQQRPDPQDLRDRNILRDTSVVSSLQSRAHDLERLRASDSLKKGLGKRPERDELVERNILPDSTAAPALQSQQQELKKHMRKDSLNEKLANRPKPEDLVKEGILEADENPLKN
ncbi:MAG: hypothetical protein M1829_001240 [Trizodia sp. TS-e1964]|nr:MAG: hypothetical protein M1829_001240 [Trizodia sp. TS-e1964]